MLCLAFVVVQAETMARGNAGVNAGRSVVLAVLRNARTYKRGIMTARIRSRGTE